MLEQLKCIELPNGRWDVSRSLCVPPSGPFSDGERKAPLPECQRVLVKPVDRAMSFRSGGMETITLHAYFDSEEKARSAETKEAFRHSIENVRNVLMQRPVCTM